MQAGDGDDVLSWLEGMSVDEAAALYGAVREPALARALLHYHARTGSQRALDLLARAPEPHAKHLLDALFEQMRTDRASKQHALSALAPLVARRPAWLHRLASHALAKELLRAARVEREPLPLLHALLALAALLPAAPALAAPHWPDLADALLRPAALAPPPPQPARDHLQLAQLALFHALYATHPVTLLDTLRAELNVSALREAWERGLAPLLTSVRLHPALVTGSRQREADAARWTRLETHDVVAEARRLSLFTTERREEPSPSAQPSPLPAEAAPGSALQAARAAASLRPGAEPWFALVDRCGADSAPHTPLPGDADVVEPPEAAVEATPENTPAKESRAHFRFPAESGAVRAIGRRGSPPGAGAAPEGYAGRLSRVLAERRATDSPVPFVGAPPLGSTVARPEPSRPAPLDAEPLNVEDREVLELTAREAGDEAWPEPEAGGGALSRCLAQDPRRRRAPLPAARAPGRPPVRSASCCARLGGARTQSVAVQTVDTWPEPYEFLIADFYRCLPDLSGEGGRDPTQPCERLDAYLAELYAGGGRRHSGNELAEQLALAHAQLMYERWRREAHAERNRRLLGRCRQARAQELQNGTLKEKVRALTRECDELRARLAREPKGHNAASAQHHAQGAEREKLEATLAAERAGRARAEAELKEAEALRAADAAELQRQRGESFEAARHLEALTRAAHAAERRAEHVRRLRRELLVLAEREARLSAVARAAAASTGAATAAAAGAEERALRAALARAEAEATAAVAKAEAATARAHELESALAARDATVAELKRAARHAAEEQAARQKALHDKYAALQRVVRANEGRRLERMASECRWPASAAAAPHGTDAADADAAADKDT